MSFSNPLISIVRWEDVWAQKATWGFFLHQSTRDAFGCGAINFLPCTTDFGLAILEVVFSMTTLRLPERDSLHLCFQFESTQLPRP